MSGQDDEGERLYHAASKTAQSLGNPYRPGMKFIWDKWLSEKDAIKRADEIVDELKAMGPLIYNGLPRERAIPYRGIRLAPPEEPPKPGEAVLRYKIIDAEQWGCTTMSSEGFIATTVLCFLLPPLMWLPCCIPSAHTKIQIPIYGRPEDLPARKLLINDEGPKSPRAELVAPPPIESPPSKALEVDSQHLIEHEGREKSGILAVPVLGAVLAPVVGAVSTVERNVVKPTIETVQQTHKSAKVGFDRITTRFVSIVDYDEY